MKDLSARVLNMAQMRGATYCDVRVVKRTLQTIAVKNGRVQELTQAESQGFGVRVIADGAWGFAASSRDEYADVDAAVNRALQIARASALTKTRDVKLGAPETSKGVYRSEYKMDPFMVPMSDKINLLLKADEQMQSIKKNGAHLVTTS